MLKLIAHRIRWEQNNVKILGGANRFRKQPHTSPFREQASGTDATRSASCEGLPAVRREALDRLWERSRTSEHAERVFRRVWGMKLREITWKTTVSATAYRTLSRVDDLPTNMGISLLHFSRATGASFHSSVTLTMADRTYGARINMKGYPP